MKISDGAVFVDFDETLAISEELGQSDKFDLIEGAVRYDHEDTKRIAGIRPGALKFLKELRQHANNVFILTTGGITHQTLVAKTLGILPLVDDLFNLGSMVPQFRFPVLVDDLGSTTSGVMAKMEKIGVIKPKDWLKRDAKMEKYVSKFLCKVEPWRKCNLNDDIFEGVVSTVLRKLSGLIRNNYWEDGEIYIPE
jgi:hypothetical protein